MRQFNATRILFFAVALLFSLTLTGCRKEDPNPELLDPIYADLDKRATESQKAYEEEVKKIEDAKVAIEKAEPNSIDLKNAERDKLKSEHLALDLSQKARFYKIRSQRRLLVDRISYKAAFAKDEKWPDPHEYSDYLVNMRLREAPPNWNVRVPKLQDRLAKTAVSTKKEEKKEE